MDSNSRGITWVGSIYQKFEAMCHEVDNLMAQEKVKYVKNQVQTSCENVQKLYLEAMHELISFPTADSANAQDYDCDMINGRSSKVDFEECPINERLLLPSQLEASVSMDKESNAIPPLDGYSMNENPLLSSQLEGSVSMDKASSAIPLFRERSVTEELLLPSQSEASVSLDKNSMTTQPVDLLQGVNHIEACDTLIKKSTTISTEVTDNYYPERSGENNILDAFSRISDSSTVVQSELVLPAISYEKVEENGLIQSGCVSSTDITEKDSSPASFLDQPQDANHLETCNVMTKKSTPISIEVAEYNYPESTGKNNNAAFAVSCTGDPLSILRCELVLHPVSEKREVEDEVILLGCVSPMDVTDSGVEPAVNGPQGANHAEACIRMAEVSTPISEFDKYKFLERAGETNNVSDVDATDTCKSLEKISLVESSSGECEQHIKHAVLVASVRQQEIAVTAGWNDCDWEEASKSAYEFGSGAETVEEFEDVKLHDDCVDSEEERDEIYLIALLANKKRSYKKKLQEALLSRLRTGKKHDCEQIVAWYRDFNRKTTQRRELKEVQTTHDAAESDWELV